MTTIGLRIENKKRLSGQRDHWVQGKSASEVDLLGDKRYVAYLQSCLGYRDLTFVGLTSSILSEGSLLLKRRYLDRLPQQNIMTQYTLFPQFHVTSGSVFASSTEKPN